MINEGIKMVSGKVLFNTKDSNGAIEEQKKMRYEENKQNSGYKSNYTNNYVKYEWAKHSTQRQR